MDGDKYTSISQQAAAAQIRDASGPDKLLGDRILKLRAMLAKNAPLGLSDYLAAQTLMVMMEMQDEQRAIGDMLYEYVIQRNPK